MNSHETTGGFQTIDEQYAESSMHKISKIFIESIILHNECHTLNKSKLQHEEQNKRVDILRVITKRLEHDPCFSGPELAPTLTMLRTILDSVVNAIAYGRSLDKPYEEVNKWGTTLSLVLVERYEDKQASNTLNDAINLSATGFVRQTQS